MSIPEISRVTGIAKTTVQRHIRKVRVPRAYRALLKEKQGGAKERAQALRTNTLAQARAFLGELSSRDRFMLLVGLYWGEGTKKDFELINSDPLLVQTFVHCVQEVLQVSPERLSMIVRAHSDVSIKKATKFWSKMTNLPLTSNRKVEVIEGKKEGKLRHGMCRIRIRSGIRERLLLQTIIMLVGKECAKKVVSSHSAPL